MGPFALALMLLAPPSSREELSREIDEEAQMPINQAARPWMSLSFTAGGALGPIDLSVRGRMAIGMFWDALELGGTLIAGANVASVYAGGGVFANWTPVPYRGGQIFYTHVGAGRLHFHTMIGGQHFDTLQFALGFRIARHPFESPFVPWVELGYHHLRSCADWAMPCDWGGTALWAPWLEAGVRFK